MENMENANELNMEEMEGAAGGGISFKKRADKAGYVQYQVKPGDTLIKIAKAYGIGDWRKIRDWNNHIDSKTNMIRSGEWLWIKR